MRQSTDLPTRHKFRSWRKAQRKMSYLGNLSPEELERQEGIASEPFFFRTVQVSSGNPLTRVLNFIGRKKLWKFFERYL